MGFKDFYFNKNEKQYLTCGRNRWMVFSIKKNESRWTFKNTETGKINFMKIDDNNEFSGMQKFLTDVLATPGIRPKTMGKINYHEFASDVLSGKKSNVYIKSGKFQDIQKTWILP